MKTKQILQNRIRNGRTHHIRKNGGCTVDSVVECDIAGKTMIPTISSCVNQRTTVNPKVCELNQ